MADQPQSKARLVFVNGDHVVAIDADGGNRQTITLRAKSLGEYDEEYDRAPRVSPDGESLLFLRDADYDNEGEFTKLMVGPADGSTVRSVITSKRLTPKVRFEPDVTLDSATWTADGKKILFTQTTEYWSHRSRWVSRIRSINADGSGLKTIITSKLGRTRGKGYHGQGLFRDIDISSDGNKILATKEVRPGGRADLNVVNLKTDRSKRLVRSANHGRWSPNGESILFLSDRDRTGEQCYEGGCAFQLKLYVAKADGSGQHQVQRQERQAGTVLGADWSPDGTRIAFGSDRNFPGMLGNSAEIYSIRPDGSCLTWLTNGSPASWDPDFSPVTATDSSPAGCGAIERDAIVDPSPPEHPLSFDGKPYEWPTLWLGPTYRGTVMYAFPQVDASGLSYFDCASFQRSNCRYDYFDLRSEEVCFAHTSQSLDDGKYRGMVRRRGGLFTRPVTPYSGDYPVATLFTGGQAIGITVESLLDEKPTKFAEYLDLVDALRPVGRDDLAGVDLDAPVFDRASVTLAGKVDVEMDGSGSIAFVAKQFNKSHKAIRAYLRFNRDIEKFGPIRLKSCRD